MITITSKEQLKELVKDAFKTQVGTSEEQAENISTTISEKVDIRTEVSGSGQ
jgi:hypothetical protein